MKILAFSDSHRNTDEMFRVLEKIHQEIYAVAHLGDGWSDIHEVMRSFPKVKLYAVTGNCDRISSEHQQLTFHCSGKKFLLTHGNAYHVKMSYQRISYFAEENEADVCLFGHTHLPTIFYAEKTLMVNPGSIALPIDPLPRTYAIINIIEENISASIVGKQKNGSYRPIDLFNNN